ncbi:MAG: hypothetical protein WAW86_05345 [Gammaproteobacteria bacterium]
MKLESLRKVLSDYDQSTNASYPFWAPLYNVIGKSIEQDEPLITKLKSLLDTANKKGEKDIRNEVIFHEVCLERSRIVNRFNIRSEYKNVKYDKRYKLTSFLLDHFITEIYEELKSSTSYPLDLYNAKSVLDYLLPYGFTSTIINDVVLYAGSVTPVVVHDEIYKEYDLPRVYKHRSEKIIDMKSIFEEGQFQFMSRP